MTAALQPSPGRLMPIPPAPQMTSQADAAIAMLEAEIRVMDLAWQYAEKLCQSRLVPTRYFQRPQDGMAAILCGAELGLKPFQSLQRIIPQRGATLEAITMVALLQDRGYTIKTISETDTAAEVHGWKPGRDPDTDNPDATYVYTLERAVRAGFVPQPADVDSLRRPDVVTDWVTVTRTGLDGIERTKPVGNMLYITDPASMLLAKARTKICRELAPEVLLGITTSTEDQRDARPDDDAPTRPVDSEPATLDALLVGSVPTVPLADKLKPAPPAPPAVEPDAPAEPADVDPPAAAAPADDGAPRSDTHRIRKRPARFSSTTDQDGEVSP